MVHIGGLTFDSDSPNKHLKISNVVAATRIAKATCYRYSLKRENLQYALGALVSKGNIEGILSIYEILHHKRPHTKITDVKEATHRDRMCTILLQNHCVETKLEYKVQKRRHASAKTTTGNIDICLDTESRRIIIELKCVRLKHLSLKSPQADVLERAEELTKMPLKEVPALRFASFDQFRSGKTIRQWIDKEVRDQLFSWFEP